MTLPNLLAFVYGKTGQGSHLVSLPQAALSFGLALRQDLNIDPP